MTSWWWDLGEWNGYRGDKLAIDNIVCPFCMEQGNFTVAFEAKKKKPNGNKTLNFTTLLCGNCAGYVMVLWSASRDMHDFRVLPWPKRTEKAPDAWPQDIGRFWVQAHRSLQDENWDAAAVMARSSLQLALRNKGAAGSNLKQEINDLSSKGLIPPIMQEWAHEVRELGNDSAHPTPGQTPTTSRDANDIVKFLDYFLEYLYSIPEQIAQYRSRKGSVKP